MYLCSMQVHLAMCNYLNMHVKLSNNQTDVANNQINTHRATKHAYMC